MSEFKGQTSITIQAPIEKVYAYLLDFPRHPEWAQNLSKVTQISAGPIAVGTTFKTEEGPPPVPLWAKLKMMVQFVAGVMSGAKPYSEAKITVLETNRRIGWEAGIPKGSGFFNFAEWEFVLEPHPVRPHRGRGCLGQGAATHLTQRFHWQPQEPGAARMVGAAGSDGLERACAVSLAQLKQRLEQSSNGHH